MSNPIKKKHTSKSKISSNLPSLQKLIILHLAESKPQTINETVKAISKSYKPSWIAFGSLEKKNLIKKTDVKVYRGRDYPLYWLTDEGMVMALLEGASSEKLFEQTKTLYPDSKITHCFLEIMPFIRPEVLKIGYSLVKENKTLGIGEVSTVLYSQSSNQMDVETVKNLADTLKKYPDEYNKFKTNIQATINQLNELIQNESS